MSRSASLRERVDAAAGTGEVLATCWDGFDFIQKAADRYAVAGTRQYHAFMFAMTSASLGRDALVFAPSMPKDPEPAAAQPVPEDTAPDDTAEEISVLASAMHDKLTAALADCPDSPKDQHAFLLAAESAAVVRDLLREP
jgi:hypothetical protein